MIVREASARDGDALLRAMASCPQGAGFVFTLVNEPDFFGRSRAYERARIFLAEAEDRLAGSAAYAIRTALIDGRAVRTGYEFQYFVAPEFRRAGVASLLRERIEQELIAEGAEITTAVIACSNLGSIRLFEQSGFACERRLSLTFLLPNAHLDMRAWPNVRPARPADLPAIARLRNDTWANSDYFTPLSAADLGATIERTPGAGLETTFVLEAAHEVVASVTIWRWQEVQQIHVIKLDESLGRRLPNLRAGEQMRNWGLTTIGFRHPDDLTQLLQTVGNLARAGGIDQIGIVVDPAHPIARAVQGFPTLDIPLGLFVKPLSRPTDPGGRPAFVDVIDI